MDFVDRFWGKTEEMPNGCLRWTSVVDRSGYGRVYTRRTTTFAAHRLAWILTYGPIPQGMCVLHRCDNPPCINPAHLFLGTDKDNAMDRDGKGRNWYSAQTVCKNGHPFDEANTYRWRTHRFCRACNRKNARKVLEGKPRPSGGRRG